LPRSSTRVADAERDAAAEAERDAAAEADLETDIDVEHEGPVETEAERDGAGTDKVSLVKLVGMSSYNIFRHQIEIIKSKSYSQNCKRKFTII
jgi:hypothetical protein